MKVAIMQPYAFPYIGYFQLINAVDKFVILDDVNFMVRGWINRNRILLNGHDYLFTIPVKKASQNRLISECELNDINWKNKFLKTLEFSYKKAPFYSETLGILSLILSYEEFNLSKWLFSQIKTICNHLNIKTNIIESSLKYSSQELKAQSKIIDICKQEGATYYYNAIGGKSLYDPEEFRKNNICLKFLNPTPKEYKQFNNDFIPSLSIIDFMMFNDIEKIQDQLNNYELI